MKKGRYHNLNQSTFAFTPNSKWMTFAAKMAFVLILAIFLGAAPLGAADKTYTGGETSATGIAVSGTNTATLPGAGETATETGDITGNAATILEIIGGGTLNLRGNNSGFLGTLNFNSGILNISSANQLIGQMSRISFLGDAATPNAAPALVIAENSTVTLNGANTDSQHLNIAYGKAGVINLENGAKLNWTNSQKDATGGAILVTITGSLTLAATGTYADGEYGFNFSGNSAKNAGGTVFYNGGAIFNDGTAALNSVKFSDNAGSSGGALYNGNTTSILTVDNAEFSNNSAVDPSGTGGAIHNIGALTVSNAVFNDNTAVTTGGAINHLGDAILTLTNVDFNRNKSTSAVGGAIFAASSGGVVLNNVNFTGNEAAGSGGAITSIRTTITGINVTFTNNVVKATGGALNLAGGATTLTNAIFTGNKAFDEDLTASFGGALYNHSSSNFTVNGGAFINNETSFGGAIYNTGSGSLTFTNVDFSGNKATGNTDTGESYGGAIRTGPIGNEADSGVVSITGGSFNANVAGTSFTWGYGGAIYATGQTIDITDTSFTNNLALTGSVGTNTGRGGAVFAANSTVNYNVTAGQTATLSGNMADGQANSMTLMADNGITSAFTVNTAANAVLDMRDPMTGATGRSYNSTIGTINITKNGAGVWKLGGGSAFEIDYTGSKTTFAVNGGELYLYKANEVANGAGQVEAGVVRLTGPNSAFTVAVTATLTARGGNSIGVYSDNAFTTAAGSITITGGATLNLHGVNALALTAGSFTIGSGIIFNIDLQLATLAAGDYTIVTANQAAFSAANIGTYNIKNNAGNIGGGFSAALTASADGKSLVVTITGGAAVNSRQLTWGGVNGNWNYADTNWKAGATTGQTFAAGDLALFDGTNATDTPLTVTVGGTSIETAGMRVTGGNYIFTGGGIVARTDISVGSDITPTGELVIEGNTTVDLTGTAQNAFNSVVIRSGTLRIASAAQLGANLSNVFILGVADTGKNADLIDAINDYAADPTTANNNAVAAALAAARGDGTLSALKIAAGQNVTFDGGGTDIHNLLVGAAGGIYAEENAVFTITNGTSSLVGGLLVLNAATGGKFVFSDNKADTGGALYNTATLYINGTEFTGNEAATKGGAIYNDAGSVAVITGGSFTGNTAVSTEYTENPGGGAIYNDTDGIINISGGTVFSGNSGYVGAAIYSVGKLTISDAAFNNNTGIDNNGVGGGGGAIYAPGDTDVTRYTITLNNVDFDANKAASGGAIFFSHGTLTVNTATFSNHVATGNGGAIFAGGVTTLNNVEFTNNQSLQSIGGAIHATNILTITDSTFNRNQSLTNGGAINFAGNELSITDTDFTGNISGTSATGYGGGAVYSSGTKFTLSGATFTNNKSYIMGGAVVANNATTVIENSVFNNNEVYADIDGDGGMGGALFWDGSNITIINTSFSDNKADLAGGAIYVYGSNLNANNITNINVTENTATFSGNMAGAKTNSIYLDNLVDFTVNTNANAVLDMRDPMSGIAGGSFSSAAGTINIIKTGAGVWKLGGGNEFEFGYAGSKTTFAVNAGELYLYKAGEVANANYLNNAAMVETGALKLAGANSAFTVGAGATLTARGGNSIGVYSDNAFTTAAGSITITGGATLNLHGVNALALTANAFAIGNSLGFNVYLDAIAADQTYTIVTANQAAFAAANIGAVSVYVNGQLVDVGYTVNLQASADGASLQIVTGSAAPGTVVVNTNNAGDGSLRGVMEAIAAGGTVRFADNVSGQTITLDTPITSAKSMTIAVDSGKTVTVTGAAGNNGGLLRFSGNPDLNFTGNLVLQGGKVAETGNGTDTVYAHGGGLYVAMVLTTDEKSITSLAATLQNNSATASNTGSINAYAQGGGAYLGQALAVFSGQAINNSASVTTVDGRAYGSGGGLYIYSMNNRDGITFSGKANSNTVTVQSQSGYAEAEGGGASLFYRPTQSTYSVFSGETNDNVINASSTSDEAWAHGGGVHANMEFQSFSGTANNNQVSATSGSNEATAYGGGVNIGSKHIEIFSGEVKGNTVSATSTSGEYASAGAGGIQGTIATLTATGSIKNNSVTAQNSGSGHAEAYGGGLSGDGITNAYGEISGNSATAISGGSGYAQALGGGANVYFSSGFNGVLSNNTVTANNTGTAYAQALGGGVYSYYGSNFSGIVSGNKAIASVASGTQEAVALGGAVYLYASFTGVDATLGAGTYTNNSATAIGANARAQGGAVFVNTLGYDPGSPYTLTLSAAAGDVTMQGNTVTTKANAGDTGVTTANAIHFGRLDLSGDSDSNAQLDIIGDNEDYGVYLHDGVTVDLNNGKSFTLTQTAQNFSWGGPNVFDAAGGGTVNLTGGTTTLLNGFSLSAGTSNTGANAAFNVGSGAALVSGGAATALNKTALNVNGGKLTVNLGSTLTLNSASTLAISNGILSVGVGEGNASGLIKLNNTSAGFLSLSGNTLDISAQIMGTYMVMESVAALDFLNLGTAFTAYTIGGNAYDSSTISITTTLGADNKTLLVTARLDQDSAEKIWNGAGATGVWDYTAADWKKAEVTGQKFVTGDTAVFNANAQSQTITLGTGAGSAVNASGVSITGGNYIFDGGKLVIDAAAAGGDVITPSGRLDISGTGSVVFNNAVEFKGGLVVAGGSTTDITLADYTGGRIVLGVNEVDMDYTGMFSGKVTIQNQSLSAGRYLTGGGLEAQNFFGNPLAIQNGSLISGNSLLAQAESENGAFAGGGGLFSSWGFSLLAGMVSGNTVKATGLIEDNSAYVEGGGVLSYHAITTLSGTVSGNTAEAASGAIGAAAYGGGVYNSGYIYVLSGTVSDNTAKASSDSGLAHAYGGGVNGNIDVLSGTVSGNMARASSNSGLVRAYGGGVLANSIGTLSGIISSNTTEAVSASNSAYALGGGLITYTVNNLSGTVSGNMAKAVSTSGSAYALGGGVAGLGWAAYAARYEYVDGRLVEIFVLESSASSLAISGGGFSGNAAYASNSGGVAHGYGGGLYAAGLVTVTAGETPISFTNNRATTKGGAFFIDTNLAVGDEELGSEIIGVNIVTGTGDIVFSGNRHGVADASGAYNAADGTANAIYFGSSGLTGELDGINVDSQSQRDAQLNISGAGLVHFADPIEVNMDNGKSFTMTQSGGSLLWGGPNVFDAAGGGTVNLTGGTTTLLNGFSLAQGNVNTAAGGKLAVNVNGGQLHATGEAAGFSDTVLSVTNGGVLSVNHGGVLTLNAQSILAFNNGILSVGVGEGNASGKVVVQNTAANAVTFTGANTLDIHSWAPGTYNMLEAQSAIAATLADFSYTVGGNALNANYSINAFLVNDGKTLQITAELLTNNGEKVWGGQSGVWNYTGANWQAGGENSDFVIYDAALFNSTTDQTVTVSDAGATGTVNAGGVKATGNVNYTLNGGALIINSANAQGLPALDYLDKLVMDGTGVLMLNTGFADNPNVAAAVLVNSGTLALGHNFKLETADDSTGALTVENGAALDILGQTTFNDYSVQLLNGAALVKMHNAQSQINLTGGGVSYLGTGVVDINLYGRDKDTAAISISNGSSLSLDASTLRLRHTGLTEDSGSWLIVDGLYTVSAENQAADRLFGAVDIATITLTGTLREDAAGQQIWFDGEYTPVVGPPPGFDGFSPNAQRAYPGLADVINEGRTAFGDFINLAYGSRDAFYADLPNFANSITAEGAVSQALQSRNMHEMTAFMALNYAFGETAAGSIHSLNINNFKSAFTKTGHGYGILANWQPASAKTRGFMASRNLNYAMNAAYSDANDFGVKVFGGYLGNFAHQAHNKGYAGYNAEYNGFLVGVAATFNEYFTAGVYGGYASGETKYKRINTKIEADTTHAGIFGRVAPGNFTFTGDVLYSHIDNDSKRNVPMGIGTQSMQGSFDQDIVSAGLEAAYNWEIDKTTVITPFIAARYSHLSQDGFTEKGNLNLHVDSFSGDSFTTALGLKLAKDFTVSNYAVITTKLTAAWKREWADADFKTNSNFAGSPVVFATHSLKENRDAALLGLGVDLLFKNDDGYSFGIKATYGGEFSGKSSEHTVFVGLEFGF